MMRAPLEGNVPSDLLTSDSKDLTPASPDRSAQTIQRVHSHLDQGDINDLQKVTSDDLWPRPRKEN